MADRIHDAFSAITATERLKASTKQSVRAACEKRSKHRFSPTVRRSVCTACAVLAVALGIGVYHSVSQTPVSYISIDVNPSIELALNRWDTVIQASPYNDDCAAILEGVSVKGMAYIEAVDLIVESEAMQPFLQDTSALTITVASDSAKREEKIKTGIEHCAGYQHYGARSCTSNVALIEEAHGNGMSFGKYAAYLLLAQYDTEITPDACRNMKMAEINNLIVQYERSEGQDEPDAAGEDADNPSSHETQQGEPARPDNLRPQESDPTAETTPGTHDESGGVTVPVPPEKPRPGERPGAAEDPPHAQDETHDHRKDENVPGGLDDKQDDAEPGQVSPPAAKNDHAEKAGQGRPDAPPAPPANGKQEPRDGAPVPDEEHDHRKDEKGLGNGDPGKKDEQAADSARDTRLAPHSEIGKRNAQVNA